MIVMEVLGIITAISLVLTAAFGGFEHKKTTDITSNPTTTQESK